jgi:trehalose synthase
MEVVDITKIVGDIPLQEQHKDPDLANAIDRLMSNMEQNHIKKLNTRRVIMINSTATGGGVAEMLPRILYTMWTFKLDVQWMVITANDKPEFFNITKKIHNFLHGQNPAKLPVKFDDSERKLFEEVNKTNADDFVKNYLKENDIVMIHDPQPSAMITTIREKFNKKQVPILWRCHIGFDHETPETKAAWDFLEKYVSQYDLTIFSAKEYAPKFAPDPRIVYPSLHPLDYKNQFLSFYETKMVLARSGMIDLDEKWMSEKEKYPWKVKMLRSDKEFVVPATDKELKNYGFLERPILLQISRWDRLKGWTELLEGFADMKKNPDKYVDKNSKNAAEHRYFIERMGLVFAGPDSSKIADDPEGLEVFISLVDQICSYPPEIQKSISMLSLPLDSRWQNALIVNALQRIASVVIQNSIREGFGLTLLEAMWKQRPCIASDACGLRQQLRPDVDGVMIYDPSDWKNVSKAINDMISAGEEKRQIYARNAKKRAIDNFLVYTQVTNYLKCITDITPDDVKTMTK